MNCGICRFFSFGLFLWVSLIASSSANDAPNYFRSVEQQRLNNGLTLYHSQLPSDGFFKLTVYAWVGSVDETEFVNEGAAHFAEHLLFQLQESGQMEFDQAMKSLGGSYNAFTYRTYTRYFVYLPVEHLQEGARLLWRVVFNNQLRQDRFEHVMQIIDRENGWNDPTWVDRLLSIFDRPDYLSREGFWGRYFGWPDFDRSVGGRPEIARVLTFEQIQAFHQRFYSAANMTAVYVGPHTSGEVTQHLNGFADRWPGHVGGVMNRRATSVQVKSPMDPYRALEFDDQQPSVNVGYLLSTLQYEDAPYLTLYTQLMRRHLYEKVRLKSAQSYHVESSAESYGPAGYLAFHSNATRISFPAIRQLMNASVLGELDKTLTPEEFDRMKADHLNYITSRMHKPEVMDAFLGLMLRKYPDHAPEIAQLDWLEKLRAIDFDKLVGWTNRTLKPQQKYEQLAAPSMFLPYEIISLIIISAIAAFFFWKRLLLNPENLRHARMQMSLTFWPSGILQAATIIYLSYLMTAHMLFLLDKLLDHALVSGMPLYLGGYLGGLFTPFVVVSIFSLALNLLPRRIVVTADRMTITSANYVSYAIPFNEIKQIRRVNFIELWKSRAVPIHLFFGRFVLVERHNKRPIAFRTKNVASFVEVLKRVMKGDNIDYRQLSFPGMRPIHVDGDH